MKKLSGQEIRRMYKQFFAERGHLVFPSASLVPHNDPTLLWINAGMAPLKPYFDGREIPERPRIVSSQKCIRTNDIENVGHTARHQTFFEMLGNFSFGDYFKQEAIPWAWEFLTQHLELDPARLSVTIHHSDDEAYAIWHDVVGLPDERIIRGDEDNFWEIGEGPCGPCSEIFYDRGAEFGCGKADCQAGCDCDRFLEIWNLVFTQYNREPDGSYTPLPKKNIDTGMGLERIASVLQDVPNNFETDLFKPLIDAAANISGQVYGQDAANDVHFKIIADHVRTVVFAIGDGALPGNEGRGYIIRRLLRRAVRSGRKLGVDRPFLNELVSVVSDIMGQDYPEVREKLDFIRKVVRTEEERFHETLADGETLLAEWLDRLAANGETTLAGRDAFKLYDTFGFPIDLTEEIAAERGFLVDRDAFAKELEQQRTRARQARQTVDGMNAQRTALETLTVGSRFVGYDELSAQAHVVALLQNGELVDHLQAGEEGQVILDVTPFYAESGGQVADQGEIRGQDGSAAVTDVQKAPHGQHVHTVKVTAGVLSIHDAVTAAVDASARRDTIKNHTATHLLHKALREVLGTHVAQAGSLVEPERLRFDFSHFGQMSPAELRDVEQRVNAAIWRDDPVVIEEMDLEAAKALGAMALFGEKYGNRVRVVQAGDYSIELCGGCHVPRTGLIGQFRIVSESGIGSGVRRIEAVTGRYAYQYAVAQETILQQASTLLKTSPAELTGRIERTLEEMRGLERALESVQARLLRGKAGELVENVVTVQDIPVVSAVVEGADAEALRRITDEIRAKLPSCVVVLGSAVNGKVALVAAVSADLQKRNLHAGKLVKQVAEQTGGGGGGRPDLAQAGGRDVDKLPAAIAAVPDMIASFLS
ncbi:alanine--tRNA ligase [Alicyclobacillus cycloheptanicus]|uniref:Alanine--tRNA ligase n=1 Tax=Alicyclobacillus cycloheptanicus TaxID=1457 RepID=A0ABT9XJQ0_9BACL|nr:alanine--tRNA ligase [Alicyclobacillus cycloheptanicus]MDQ0190513.1 alanyl-tRNA synthetase [Alicyclobacillus cycloheptanicus]WDM00725.1 alanine--tRNA ligase [Alicyclobacillus cycloheptanicus]